MSLLEDLENLIKIWKERHTYLGLQAREAFEVKDMALQATIINNRKQIKNCINDVDKILNDTHERVIDKMGI